MTSGSPYERALGSLVGDLHPRLRAYFSQIPEGSVGTGRGTFDAVGTPRRWLWPFIALLSRDGVLVPTWSHNVPFEVENAPDATGSRSATRTFHLPTRTWRMVDAIGFHEGRLEDRLGSRGWVAAELLARVEEGALRMRSGSVRLGVIRIPRFIAPRVSLLERFDESSGRQHVSLTLELPVIGRIYEYSGSFDYAIRIREK